MEFPCDITDLYIDVEEQMIAIGGSIGRLCCHYAFVDLLMVLGTGLFVSSGAALQTGGPASLLIAYLLLGGALFCTVQALGTSLCGHSWIGRVNNGVRRDGCRVPSGWYVNKETVFCFGVTDERAGSFSTFATRFIDPAVSSMPSNSIMLHSFSALLC
jgi:hypothetical protein